MLRFSSNSSNSYIIIFGDFNARSSNLPDYVQLDVHISDSNGLQDVYEENVTILNYFETFNVPLNRKIADPNTNMYGNTMLEFCKNYNLFILNGRVGQDYITPKLTCKEKSTMDYILSSASTFENIKDFQVEEFNCLFSDAHCAVTLMLNLQWGSNVEKRALKEETVKTIFWQSDKSEVFIENFDIMKVAEIENYLDHLIETNNIEETQVNEIVNNINGVFEECAKESFGCKTRKTDNKYSKFKPWFNRDCINARNVYHKTHKMYNSYKTEYYKNMLKHVSKQYKQTLNKNCKKFKNERIQKLRRIKTNDPKQYWKIINAERRPTQTSAPLTDLFNFYKESCKNDIDENTKDNILNSNIQADDPHRVTTEEINKPIAAEEILHTVKTLKTINQQDLTIFLWPS